MEFGIKLEGDKEKVEKELTRKKYNSLDLIKWIMAIFVIAVHTHPLETIQNNFIYKVYEVMITMAVPFFFMTSAYLLFYKMNGLYAEDNNIKIIDKYIIRIIKLYLIWNVLYFPLAIYDYAQSGTGVLKSIALYIRGFFFVGEHFYSWPLWYLLSTIYSMVLIRILLKKRYKEWHILFLSIAVFIMAQIMTYLVNNQANLNGILYLFARLVRISIGDGRILTGLCYIAIGMFIARYKVNVDWKILLLTVIISFAISVYYSNFMLLLLLYTVFFLLALSINLSDRKVYYYLRRASTIMYFTHMFFFFYFSIKVGMKQKYGLIGFLFTFICSVILSLIIIGIQKKKEYKILKELFN